jgi:hypothetical protein
VKQGAAPLDRKTPPLNSKMEIVAARAYLPSELLTADIVIPVGAREIEVYLGRDGSWPDLGKTVAVIRLTQYFSDDDGVTWQFGGSSDYSGHKFHRFGQAYTESSIITSGLGDTTNPRRILRVEATPFFPLTTKLSAQAKSRPTL